MLLFIFIVWTLSAIFSYSFFYFNILPGMNPYYLFLFVCLLNSFYYLVRNKGALNWSKYGGKEHELYFKFFTIWTAFFILVSFFNLPQVFGIQNLLFDSSYIIRHAFFLPAFAIMYSVYISTIKTNNIENVRRFTLLCIMLTLFLISKLVGYDNIVYTQLMVMLASLYFVKKKSYLALYLLIFFVVIETTSMSSFLIASIIVVFILLCGKEITTFLAREFNFKTAAVLMLSFIGVIVLHQWLMEIISSDANSLWRLNVWKNEFRSLAQTYGIGVGFGAAYVDNHIYFEVDNSNMYETISDLFVVANHNSIVNMFYRLGIVGGVTFILMNLTLVKWYAKTYVLNTKYNNYLLWAFTNYVYSFIIISLNPGLESPRFSFGYLISIGFLIGFIMKSRQVEKA